MSSQSQTSPAVAPSPPAPTGGPVSTWARPVIEAQVAMLSRLAEAGLDLALAIEAEATAADAPAGAAMAAAAPYARAARAVRLTIALQSKLIGTLQELERGRSAEACQGRSRVERIVERVIEAEHADHLVAGRLEHEARERLDHDDIYGDVLSRPVSEIVAEICRDLSLSPDWPRLAQEAWAREEVMSGRTGSPLAALAGTGRPPSTAFPKRSAAVVAPCAASP